MMIEGEEGNKRERVNLRKHVGAQEAVGCLAGSRPTLQTKGKGGEGEKRLTT
jgi:hypothetical protein